VNAPFIFGADEVELLGEAEGDAAEPFFALLELEFFFAEDFFELVDEALAVADGVAVTTFEFGRLLLLLIEEVFVFCFKVVAEAAVAPNPTPEPNCGGVIDKTAPRPPTVPPAINTARFMPYLFFRSAFNVQADNGLLV
jgi:hypothetical protein